jgi:hypothetical protein
MEAKQLERLLNNHHMPIHYLPAGGQTRRKVKQLPDQADGNLNLFFLQYFITRISVHIGTLLTLISALL